MLEILNWSAKIINSTDFFEKYSKTSDYFTFTLFFTSSTNVFEGLNEGIL